MNYAVCLTVFGKSPYLSKQIESILNQSIPPSQIVVVEDFSGISAKDFIEDLLCDARIPFKILSNCTNLGPAKSFRKAILASDFDLIYFSDQDDIWHVNRVLNSIEFLNDNFLVVCNAKVIYSDNRTSHPLYDQSEFDKTSLIGLILRNFIVGATMAANVAHHRDFIKKSNLEPMHDWTFAIMSILSMKKIKFIDSELITYRRHSQTFTGRKNNSIFKKIKFRFSILCFVKYFAIHRLLNNKCLK